MLPDPCNCEELPRPMALLRPELIEMLACPVPECRRGLTPERDGLRCTGCRRWYAVTEGRPVLIPEEATLPDERNRDPSPAGGNHEPTG